MAKQPKYEIEDWETAYNAATDDQSREKAFKEYEAAKLRNAERREEYRIACAIERSERRRDAFKAGTKKVQSWIATLGNGAKKAWDSFIGLFQKTK